VLENSILVFINY